MAERGRFRQQLEALYGSRKAYLYSTYLEGPLLDLYGKAGVRNIKNRLLNQERVVDRTVLSQLHQITVDAYEHPTPFVQQARAELQDFFVNNTSNPHADERIRRSNIVLILYGSLQYGDPRNCDVDLYPVVSEGFPIPADTRALIWNLGIDLDTHWVNLSEFEGRRRGDPHFGHKIYDLTKYRDVDAIIEDEPEFENLGGFAAVISGVALFPQDQAKVEEIQERALEIVELDPLLCAITNVEFADCLKERLARRVR